MLAFLVITVLGLFLLSVYDNEKFDKTKWSVIPDPGFAPPFRKQMLKDLTANYKLVGCSYSQIVGLLGKPDFKDSCLIGYSIVIDYGYDIDPVYTKNLEFFISRDSVVHSYKIVEWKN